MMFDVYIFLRISKGYSKNAQDFPALLPTLDAGGMLFVLAIRNGTEIAFRFLQGDGDVDSLQIRHKMLDILVT